MSVTEQIEAVFPESLEVKIKGKTYTVKPFGIGKYPKVIKLFSTVLKDRKEGEGMDWLTLIGEHGDKVITLFSMTIGEPEQFFDDVAPDEAFALGNAIIQLNSEVITKKLIPQLAAMGGQLAETVGSQKQTLQ